MERIILKEKLVIPPVPDSPGDDGNGVNSFIYRGSQLEEIQEHWGRTGCCVKVFKNREKFQDNVQNAWWGPSVPHKGSKLPESTHIQNIFAHHSLAPRVYAIFVLVINGKRHWAQLVEDMGHLIEIVDIQPQMIKGPMKEIADKYGITMFDDGRDCNVVNGKYVDFQGFHLMDNYKDKLKERIVGIANVGKWGPWMNYHNIPELEITGGRNNELRVEQMKLKQIDFRGKTVLDIGCSEGWFCNYAEKRGAKTIVGTDLPGVVENLWELSSYLGCYNVDYQGHDLKTDAITAPYDIVFFFSMCQHIGFPDWISTLTNEVLVFEGNSKGEDTPTIEKMKQTFKIEEKGKTTDLFERPVIWAKR